MHRIPVGVYEGMPLLAVDFQDVQGSPERLAEIARRSAHPGHFFIEVMNVDWGSPESEAAFIDYFSSAPEQKNVWNIRQCTDKNWSGMPLWTVLDISPIMTGSRSTKEYVQAVRNLPLMPRPREVVAILPSQASLTDTILDEVYSNLDPDHAWLYVDESAYEAACLATMRCSSGWGVRLV